MNQQNLDMARLMLNRLTEDNATRSSLGLRLKRSNKTDDQASDPQNAKTRIRRRTPYGLSSVDPKGETADLPHTGPGQTRKLRGFSSARPSDSTADLPSRSSARAGSSSNNRGDHPWQSAIRGAAKFIRDTAQNPNAPAWQRNLVKKPQQLIGTPYSAAPEQWHDDDDGVHVQGRVRVDAKSPEKREAQRREVAGTIANAANRPTYTCTNDSGQTYTSTMRCPEKHKRLFSTQPTPTQRAMEQVIWG